MASGDTLAFLTPLAGELPGSTFATPDVRNNHPVLDFDAGADEIAYFTAVLSRAYSGGGITVRIYWAASSATTGNIVLSVAFERIADEAQDIDSDGFATANTATAAAPATSGMIQYTDITFTNGAQIDSVAVGELFRISVSRLGTNGSDTMTGDAEVAGIELRET